MSSSLGGFLGRDVLSARSYGRDDYLHLFDVADRLRHHASSRRNTTLLSEKTLVTAFYQPSTRTRLAHEAAMHRLGGRVVGFADPATTRAGDFYQESVKDTVKMLESYGDVIAMRHYQLGAPTEAARWATVPVINAGDGWGEHPTQAMTDMYTVYQAGRGLDGLHWLAVGDMRMRSMRSLALALSRFDCGLTLVAPPDMSLADDIRAEIVGSGLCLDEREHVEQAVSEADVIIVEPVVQPDYARPRDERPATVARTPDAYRITLELLRTRARAETILLHSLPRMDEIPVEVDDSIWQRYWDQSFNGVVSRMAILALVLGAID